MSNAILSYISLRADSCEPILQPQWDISLPQVLKISKNFTNIKCSVWRFH